MPITFEALPSLGGDAQSYRVQRGSTTYYMTETLGTESVYVSQVYVSRLGRRGERRLPDGRVRDDLLRALALHKTLADIPLRERLCTPMTVGEASAAASTVL